MCMRLALLISCLCVIVRLSLCPCICRCCLRVVCALSVCVLSARLAVCSPKCVIDTSVCACVLGVFWVCSGCVPGVFPVFSRYVPGVSTSLVPPNIMQQDVQDCIPEEIPKTDMRARTEMDSMPSLCVFVRWFMDEYPRRCGWPTATAANAAEVQEKVHEKELEKELEKPAQAALLKPTKVRATDLFNLYSDLLGRAGFDKQFQNANSLVRRLKRDFPLFQNLMKRESSGSCFVAQNMADLYEQAAELDAKYRFDLTLFGC
jgi:hypothetical protein